MHHMMAVSISNRGQAGQNRPHHAPSDQNRGVCGQAAL